MSGFCPLSPKNTVKLLCDAMESRNTCNECHGQIQGVLKKLGELLWDAENSINTSTKLKGQLQPRLNKLCHDMREKAIS